MDSQKDIDVSGALSLITLSLLLGLNQVAIKFTNEGLQPIFWAGLRSAIAATGIAVWLKFQGKQVQYKKDTMIAGITAGLVFALEFLFLFLALDLTTIVRTSVLLYSMPIWLTIGAHFLFPEERITLTKLIGLALAMIGVVIAMFGQNQLEMDASFLGDLCALAAAFCWACIPFCTRLTKLNNVIPEMQLMWMVTISVPVLLIASVFFGPVIRDFQLNLIPVLLFQAVIVVTGGFLLWLHMLRNYPANSVASFSFLAPIFGVFFGWLLFDENVGLGLLVALVLVSVGIVIINRPSRH